MGVTNAASVNWFQTNISISHTTVQYSQRSIIQTSWNHHKGLPAFSFKMPDTDCIWIRRLIMLIWPTRPIVRYHLLQIGWLPYYGQTKWKVNCGPMPAICGQQVWMQFKNKLWMIHLSRFSKEQHNWQIQVLQLAKTQGKGNRCWAYFASIIRGMEI